MLKARFSIHPETQAKSSDGLEVGIREPVGRFLFPQKDMLLSRNAFCVTELTRTYATIQYTNRNDGWVCRRDSGQRDPISKEHPFNLTRMYNGDTLLIPATPDIVGSFEGVLKLTLLAEDEEESRSLDNTQDWDDVGKK